MISTEPYLLDEPIRREPDQKHVKRSNAGGRNSRSNREWKLGRTESVNQDRHADQHVGHRAKNDDDTEQRPAVTSRREVRRSGPASTDQVNQRSGRNCGESDRKSSVSMTSFQTEQGRRACSNCTRHTRRCVQDETYQPALCTRLGGRWDGSQVQSRDADADGPNDLGVQGRDR